jgi:dihydroorotase
VTDIGRCLPALRAMAEAGVLLLVHGEVTDPEVDMFDREAVFIETKLVSRRRLCAARGAGCGLLRTARQHPLLHNPQTPPAPPPSPHTHTRKLEHTHTHTQKPLLEQVPTLKVVMEHITTADAAAFVAAAPDNVAATVTPQHMLLNRNALFAASAACVRVCVCVRVRAFVRACVRVCVCSAQGRQQRAGVVGATCAASASVGALPSTHMHTTAVRARAALPPLPASRRGCARTTTACPS